MDDNRYNSSIKVGDTVERVSNLYLIKSKNINQTDYVLTGSGDADAEDNLDNDNLLTMSQLTKSEERRSLYSNVKDHFPLTCNNDKLLKPSQYIELLFQNEDT